MIKKRRKNILLRSTKSDILFDIVVHLSLIALLIVTLYPVVYVFSVSVSDPIEQMKNNVTLLPKGFHLRAYAALIKAGRVPRGFKNSLIYTAIGTVISMIMTIFMAYPLSKKNLKFRSFYTMIMIFTMFFGGGLIPTFILINKLGLFNTMWAPLLGGAVGAFYVIILRTFFMSVPVEMEESSFIDGANQMQILFLIELPLSKAAIATISLFYAVGIWQDFFSWIVYIYDYDKYPLQVLLQKMIIAGQMLDEENALFGFERQAMTLTLRYATLFISIVPLLLIYPFIQKYFVKGVMIGAFKG